MSRWVTWAKSRSRRRRSVRPRILRIDELENRRLLCSTLLGGSLERSFQDDEFEIEDRFETDEGDDLPLAATWGRAAVVDSRDAEGEDDEWEDETEDWTYTIPTTPISSNQVPAGSGDSSTAPSQVSPGNLFPTTATASSASELGESAESDSVLAFRGGNAFWFARVVVLDVSGTHDEDASAEEDTPATSIARTADGGAKTLAASPTRTTEDDLDEAESSAPETDIRSDRDALQPNGGDATATSQSPGQTELANLVAATANPLEEKPGANLDQKDAVGPTALSTRVTQGDVTLASDHAEAHSLAPGQTNAGGSSGTLEMPSLARNGLPRPSLTAAETLSRHAPRRVETPPGSHQDERAWIFAALAPESYGTGNWRLRDALSQDLAALETALQDLLADSGEIGRDVADWVLRPDVIHWTLAATIALVAAEIIRQKAQRSRLNEQQPPSDGADVSLRLFPELLGLPPGTGP